MADETSEERVGKVVKALEEAKSDYHDAFMQRVDSWYAGYRGYVDLSTKMQEEWRSNLHPPYVFQVIETIVANLVDDTQRFSVKPRPKMMQSDPATLQQMILGARAMELLLRYENDVDNFQLKQRAFTMQGTIAGLTVGKTYWDFETTTARSRVPKEQVILGDDGRVLGNAVVLEEVEHPTVLRDNSAFDVIDVHDFFYHSGATDIQRAAWVIHRAWYTYEELEMLEAVGTYKNVTDLSDTRDFQSDRNSYDDIFRQNNARGLIEVLEYWDNKGEVITVGNRSVELRHDEVRPFWHGRYPFVVASSMPDLFRIPGISDVEIVHDLQRALWDMMNQRLDNLSLINNAIFIVRGDIEDAEDWEFEPGARWVLESGNPSEAVVPWSPNPLPAEVSIDAERMIKGDIQDITGGMPFMSGTDSQVDNKTATGVSIFTSLGQRRLAAKKQNFQLARKQIAEFQMSDLAQFLPEDRLVPILGKDGAASFVSISPLMIQGQYVAEVEPMNESMMRQERRAEKQMLMTTAAQIAAVMASSGTPINLAENYKDMLRAFDIEDPERYFTQQMPAGMPGGPGGAAGPGNPGDPAASADPNLGVTAQPSDAANPNADMAMSPVTALQRAQAMSGGGRNA